MPESRVIAGLLLRAVSERRWRKAIYDENVLQARSPKTAKRLSVLIRGRLSSVESPLWKLVKDGSVVEATHACLAAAVKSSFLWATFSIWFCGISTEPSRNRSPNPLGRLHPGLSRSVT